MKNSKNISTIPLIAGTAITLLTGQQLFADATPTKIVKEQKPIVEVLKEAGTKAATDNVFSLNEIINDISDKKLYSNITDEIKDITLNLDATNNAAIDNLASIVETYYSSITTKASEINKSIKETVDFSKNYNYTKSATQTPYTFLDKKLPVIEKQLDDLENFVEDFKALSKITLATYYAALESTATTNDDKLVKVAKEIYSKKKGEPFGLNERDPSILKDAKEKLPILINELKKQKEKFNKEQIEGLKNSYMILSKDQIDFLVDKYNKIIKRAEKLENRLNNVTSELEESIKTLEEVAKNSSIIINIDTVLNELSFEYNQDRKGTIIVGGSLIPTYNLKESTQVTWTAEDIAGTGFNTALFVPYKANENLAAILGGYVNFDYLRLQRNTSISTKNMEITKILGGIDGKSVLKLGDDIYISLEGNFASGNQTEIISASKPKEFRKVNEKSILELGGKFGLYRIGSREKASLLKLNVGAKYSKIGDTIEKIAEGSLGVSTLKYEDGLSQSGLGLIIGAKYDERYNLSTDQITYRDLLLSLGVSKDFNTEYTKNRLMLGSNFSTSSAKAKDISLTFEQINDNLELIIKGEYDFNNNQSNIYIGGGFNF